MFDALGSPGFEPFTGRLSLARPLETAIAIESGAHRFYAELASRVRPEVKPLVESLANEELRHRDLLQALAGDPDLVEQLRAHVDLPAPVEAGAYISLPELGLSVGEDDILDYAGARERVARDYYAYVAEQTPPSPLRDLFRFLRDEEERHAEQIGARWSEVFSIP